MISNEETLPATENVDILQTLGINQSSERRGRYLKWGGIATVTVVIIIILLWFGGDDSQTLGYKTAEVTRGSLTVTVIATGTLEPVKQVEVGSEISGTIRTVLVDFNDRVKQGQVLATMDTDQFQARVNQAKAMLQLAMAQVRQSEVTVSQTRNKSRRAKDLAKSGMCSEEECEAAQANYDRAVADLTSNQARVVQAQAALDAEQTILAKATILSPIDGLVLKRDVEPGQTMAASFQTPVLFTLAENLMQMELQVDVDEADVGQVKPGQDATFTVDAYPNRHFPARITEVHFASQTVEGVVTYKTVLNVNNSDLSLRPGMTATADIIVNYIENALLVPNAALRFTPPVPQEQTSKPGASLVSSLIPRPPSGPKQREGFNTGKNQQQIWRLQEGQPMSVLVQVGASDGILTELVSGDIRPGMVLLVDTISSRK